MNYLKTNLPVEAEACTGCGACRAICPVNAIGWEKDHEGLMHPILDKKVCIHCGKCIKVCPVLEKTEKNCFTDKNLAYAAKAINKELLMKSSSGGLFGLLAEQILKERGYVCGCAWNQDFKSVHHKLINTQDELALLYESKYLQSNVSPDIYHEILSLIRQGKQVVFCGTPCEVSGLNRFLSVSLISEKQISESLLRISLICHGTPSPAIWERYIEELEKQYNSKVIFAHFRDKSDSWQNPTQIVCFENGEKHISCVRKPDIFMYLFAGINNIILRRSCSNCVCKRNYQADITLGDFWGIDKIMPKLSIDGGVSVVVVHTEHGQMAFNSIFPMLSFCKPTRSYIVERYNSKWRNCLPIDSKRKIFFKLFNNYVPLKEINRKLTQKTLYERIITKIILYKKRFKNFIRKLINILDEKIRNQ